MATRFDTDGNIVRIPNPPQRNALLGETILIYETGSESEIPLLAIVAEVSQNGLVRPNIIVPGGARFRHPRKTFLRHMDDPYWNDPKRSGAKYATGAYDFHPVAGPQYDMALVRAARDDKKAEKSDSKTPEKVEA